MRLNIDEDTHVLWLDLDSGVSAANALEQALALLHRLPALWSWDWIVKATVLPTDVTIDHLARLAEIYVPPASPARTLLVSEDRYLHLWARVMDFQFAPRRHIVVRRTDDAIRLAGATREVS